MKKGEAEMGGKTLTVLFDALCPLCTQTVAFLKKRDRKAVLRFISMHSLAGQNLMKTHGVTLEMDTFVVIKDTSCLIRSDAVIEIAKQLGGCWQLLRCFSVLKRPFRDGCYAFVAKNRYRWFGRHEVCPDEVGN